MANDVIGPAARPAEPAPIISAVDPTVIDDAHDGYVVGQHWINTATGNELVATDVTVGAAVWKSTTSGGGGGTVPSGTGFTHVTAGSQDGAAKLVADADVSASAAIALSKLATQAAGTLVGNNTAGTAVPIPLTAAQAKTLLAIANTDVSGLGTLSTQNGTFSGTSSGTNTGDQTISDATITTTDITTNNVSTTKHGFAPKAPNIATQYLDGTGAWSTPPGGGSVPTGTGFRHVTSGVEDAASGVLGVGLAFASATLDAIAHRSDFGDGSDGSATFDGTNTFASFVTKSGNVYTLIRDVMLTSATVNAGCSVITAGFTLYGTGTLTINATGSVHNGGNNGGNASGTNSGTGGSAGTGSLGGNNCPFGAGTAGVAGANGAIGAGAQSSVASNQTLAYYAGTGGSGGAGGNGTSGSGALSKGSVTGTAKRARKIPLEPLISTGVQLGSGGIGGCGGSSASGDGTNVGGGGGGGGSGGGVCHVLFRTIVNNGSVHANGGNGGNGGTPTTGNCGGGGAGGPGAGGTVGAGYESYSGSGTITANAGSPGSVGTGVGSGTTPSLPSQSVTNGVVLKYNFKLGVYE